MSDTDELEPEVEMKTELALPAFEEGPTKGVILTDSAKAFLPVALEDIRAVAQMLSAFPGTRPEFQTPAACEPIVLQAALWRVSPLFVLQCAYAVKAGAPIGYEAKLIHAVILANAPLSRRPRLQYGYSDPARRIPANRFVKATYWVIGEAEPFTVTSPTVSQIKVRNSPLWFSDPDAQLAYYINRSAARTLFPDVLGGAYTREEVVQLRTADDLEHARARNLFNDDEPIDADFEDHIPPTEADHASYARAEAKAAGVQDSKDPRDDPRNRETPPTEGPGPGAADSGANEPGDMDAIRAWVANEERLILALAGAAQTADRWKVTIADKRWGRFKAYDQAAANEVRARVTARVEALRADG